jgi:hypothetical protein
MLLAVAVLLVWILIRYRTTRLLAISAASLLLAGAPSLVVLHIAWIENSQGEIHGPGYVDWGYWFALGASWFLPTYLLAFLSAACVGSLFSAYRRRVKLRHAA